MELRYEVMYLLDADDTKMAAFREVWTGLGDSIVIVGDHGLYNCHIHTDDVGAAIEASLDAGRPRNIRVTDLADQVIEERWVREAHGNARRRSARRRPHHVGRGGRRGRGRGSNLSLAWRASIGFWGPVDEPLDQ